MISWIYHCEIQRAAESGIKAIELGMAHRLAFIFDSSLPVLFSCSKCSNSKFINPSLSGVPVRFAIRHYFKHKRWGILEGHSFFRKPVGRVTDVMGVLSEVD